MSKRSNRSNNEQIPKKNNIAKEVNQVIDPIEKNTWEQLDGIYKANAEALITISQEVNSITNHPDFASKVENKEETLIVLKGFKRDIETLTEDLVGIKALHKGKVGEIINEKDLVDSLNIFDNYVDFTNRFSSCVEPIVNILTDINLSIGLDKLEEKSNLKKALEQNSDQKDTANE